MNKNQINITDFPPKKIYVLLNKTLRTKLVTNAKKVLQISKDFDLANWLNKKSIKYELNTNFNGGDIKNWLVGKKIDIRTKKIHPRYMPLWILLELAKLAGICSGELSKTVVSYRSGGSGNLIFNPRLPVKITPELESIIFHLFGDGSAGNFTPSYFQKNKMADQQFLRKLKACFGDFTVARYRNKWQIRFPKAITDILTHFYKIKSYHSDKIKIPSKIYQSDKWSKLACITAFILDEGNIRDLINISSKNKTFLTELKELIESCGYVCQPVKPHKPSNTFYLNLSNKSIELFYRDYVELIKQFPCCGLANKHKSLVYIISRRKNKSNIKDIDKAILNLLKKNELTTMKIAQILGFAYCTILHHLENLHTNGFVARIRKERSFIWSAAKVRKKRKN